MPVLAAERAVRGFSCWSAEIKLIAGQSSVISQVLGSFSP
jgi:hypothetical protein